HNSLGRVRALARASGVEAIEAEQKAAAASLFTDMKRPVSTGG
ncbi:FadR family transcriptional regulator, partial [Mesorhizobium sp. M7A.F.Ca.ET.027.03.2.1]